MGKGGAAERARFPARRESKGCGACADAADAVKKLLADVQHNLFEMAKKRKEERVVSAETMDELLKGVEGGNFVKAGWCGCRECEDKIKEQTAATARVIVEGEHAEKCVCCGKEAKQVVLFARAY